MKKYLSTIIALVSFIFIYSSCIKQIDKVYTGAAVAELDGAVLNSNTAGVTYPIITRHAPMGYPIATADSTLRRIGRLYRVRINLVGAQSGEDQTVGYKIFDSPITTIAFPASASGQTPSQSSGTLNVTTAVPGTHYTTLTGIATIPKGTSFGYIDINILNAGAAAGQGRFIGIQLDSSGTIKPNPNYNKLGLVIDQR